jgi:hypothetical protein
VCVSTCDRNEFPSVLLQPLRVFRINGLRASGSARNQTCVENCVRAPNVPRPLTGARRLGAGAVAERFKYEPRRGERDPRGSVMPSRSVKGRAQPREVSTPTLTVLPSQPSWPSLAATLRGIRVKTVSRSCEAETSPGTRLALNERSRRWRSSRRTVGAADQRATLVPLWEARYLHRLRGAESWLTTFSTAAMVTSNCWRRSSPRAARAASREPSVSSADRNARCPPIPP